MTVELPVLSCQQPHFKAKAVQDSLNFKKCVLKAEIHDCKYVICIVDCRDLKFLQVLHKEMLMQQTLVHCW